jgi:flagellar biosynthesis GTPase FlhF
MKKRWLCRQTKNLPSVNVLSSLRWLPSSCRKFRLRQRHLEAPVAKAQPAVSSEPSVAAPAAPGLLSRLVSALKNLFAGSETAAPAEVQEEKKEEKQERQQDRRKSRQGNRRDRNERREPRADGNEGRENRDDNRRNRREKPQQNAEAREARQPVPVAAEETEKRNSVMSSSLPAASAIVVVITTKNARRSRM